jgi:hypothetical protein
MTAHHKKPEDQNIRRKTMNRPNIDPRSKTPTLRISLGKSLFRQTLFSVCTLACLALSTARAVDPPPDGGYPVYNTAEGTIALNFLTTGIRNTAIGYSALFDDTTGSDNTAIGSGVLSNNITGNNNTATGSWALFSNGASYNTAFGGYAMYSNTSGTFNTANGFDTLYSNTTGQGNTASGDEALYSNTTGGANTATGETALYLNTTGNENTGDGVDALFSNTTGNDNAAVGTDALYYNRTGSRNTAIGHSALLNNTSGGSNIAVGYSAGSALTTGSNNIDIGARGVAAEANTIRIGKQATQTATYIAGIMGKTVSMGTPVFVNASGKLGTVSSSARFKDHIKPMDKASEAVLALKPVTFHYKKELDPDATRQFGLVAEEVEKVNPDLVTRDAEGKVYTVRYEAVNAMLLNEFLKEHRRVEEQGCEIQEEKSTVSQLKITVARQDAIIAQQQKEMETVVAHLKEQESKIQRVSHQVEMSKFATGRIRRGGHAPRMVLNP